MDLYFLWSLERVGVLYNLPKIEDKDWYAWGSKTLLARQQPDGNWKDGAYWGPPGPGYLFRPVVPQAGQPRQGPDHQTGAAGGEEVNSFLARDPRDGPRPPAHFGARPTA